MQLSMLSLRVARRVDRDREQYQETATNKTATSVAMFKAPTSFGFAVQYGIMASSISGSTRGVQLLSK